MFQDTVIVRNQVKERPSIPAPIDKLMNRMQNKNKAKRYSTQLNLSVIEESNPIRLQRFDVMSQSVISATRATSHEKKLGFQFKHKGSEKHKKPPQLSNE